MMDGRIMNAIRAVTCGGFLLIAGTQFPANAASMLVPGDYGVWLKEGYECGDIFPYWHQQLPAPPRFDGWDVIDCPDLDENLCQAILHGYYEYWEADTDWACAGDCLDLAGADDYVADAVGCQAACQCTYFLIED